MNTKKIVALIILIALTAAQCWGAAPMDLFTAVQNGDIQSIQYLLDNKIVDPDALDQYGYTALMSAIIKCKISAIITLLNSGVNVNFVSRKQGTALLVAISPHCLNNKKTIISLLLHAGATQSINETNADFQTPLMLAASWNLFYELELLLDNNADTTLTNFDGDTALSIAQKKQRQDPEFYDSRIIEKLTTWVPGTKSHHWYQGVPPVYRQPILPQYSAPAPRAPTPVLQEAPPAYEYERPPAYE